MASVQSEIERLYGAGGLVQSPQVQKVAEIVAQSQLQSNRDAGMDVRGVPVGGTPNTKALPALPASPELLARQAQLAQWQQNAAGSPMAGGMNQSGVASVIADMLAGGKPEAQPEAGGNEDFIPNLVATLGAEGAGTSPQSLSPIGNAGVQPWDQNINEHTTPAGGGSAIPSTPQAPEALSAVSGAEGLNAEQSVGEAVAAFQKQAGTLTAEDFAQLQAGNPSPEVADSWFDKLSNDPAIKDLLLGLGIGLLQGKGIGDALAQGVQYKSAGAGQRGAAGRNKQEAEKLRAETGKLDAETASILSESDGDVNPEDLNKSLVSIQKALAEGALPGDMSTGIQAAAQLNTFFPDSPKAQGYKDQVIDSTLRKIVRMRKDGEEDEAIEVYGYLTDNFGSDVISEYVAGNNSSGE